MHEPTFDPASRANRFPWPPVLFASALGLGLVLTWLMPIGLPLPVRGGALEILGAVFIALALIAIGWAITTLWNAHTTVMPHLRADHLVTDGPYAFTRNPIYFAESFILLGAGLLLHSLWLILIIPLFVFAVIRLAISREEAHLAARFGIRWEEYSTRVRRWM